MRERARGVCEEGMRCERWKCVVVVVREEEEEEEEGIPSS